MERVRLGVWRYNLPIVESIFDAEVVRGSDVAPIRQRSATGASKLRPNIDRAVQELLRKEIGLLMWYRLKSQLL
jgi:hypothetical protein